MLRLSKHIMRWELHFPHTNRHQNKQAPQLAYICRTVLSCTCKLLSEGLVPKLLPLLYLTSKLLSFGMCTPNYRQKKHFGLPSRGTESIPVQTFYKLMFYSSWQQMFVDLFSLSFLMERCWFLFENPLFFSRTGSNPVETSGDDSGCISDTHHM